MSITDAFNSELGQEVKRLREENEEVHAAVIRKQKELMEMRMDMVTEEWIPYDVMQRMYDRQ